MAADAQDPCFAGLSAAIIMIIGYVDMYILIFPNANSARRELRKSIILQVGPEVALFPPTTCQVWLDKCSLLM